MARPAAWQREAFIRGHKAHQIQLFWKVGAVLPAPKGYSHELNPLSAVLLLLVFSLSFFVFSLFCSGGVREGQFYVLFAALPNMSLFHVLSIVCVCVREREVLLPGETAH